MVPSGEPRKKSPVTPPGIDPGTVRLVAQCLDHYATPDPRSCSKAVYKPVWHIPLMSVQWINCWWWTEELSETCRISWQNKFVKLVHLVGFIINKKYIYSIECSVKQLNRVELFYRNWPCFTQSRSFPHTIRKFHHPVQTACHCSAFWSARSYPTICTVFKTNYDIINPSTPSFFQDVCQGFLPKLCMHFSCLTRAVFSSYPILHGFIILIIIGQDKLWRVSLFNFLHPTVAPPSQVHVFSPGIHFSNTLSPYSSLLELPSPLPLSYRTTDKIIVVYILFLQFSIANGETEDPKPNASKLSANWTCCSARYLPWHTATGQYFARGSMEAVLGQVEVRGWIDALRPAGKTRTIGILMWLLSESFLFTLNFGQLLRPVYVQCTIRLQL